MNEEKIKKSKIKKSQSTKKKKQQHTRKYRNQNAEYFNPNFTIKSIQNKGFGIISSVNIPINIDVIHETPIIYEQSTKKYSSYNFYEKNAILLDQILQNPEQKTKFLKITPNKLSPQCVDYSIVKHLHHKYFPTMEKHIFQLYMCKMTRNVFNFNDLPAILFYGTLLNHSCEPNVQFRVSDNGKFMTFTTIRPINAGDEVCDSYLNEETIKHMSLTERQHNLHKQYDFLCTCSRCIREQSTTQ